MKKFYLCKLCLIVFGALLAVQSANAVDMSNEAFQLYFNVKQGVVSFESLTPAQQRNVIELDMLLSDSSSQSGDSSECREARADADSTSDELARYARRLLRCASSKDFDDDCSTEFRRVKNAFRDYESASSDFDSYCD
jgi:hypothetical protein